MRFKQASSFVDDVAYGVLAISHQPADHNGRAKLAADVVERLPK